MAEQLSSLHGNSQWGQATGQDQETIAHLQHKLTQASRTLLEKHILYKEAVKTAEQLYHRCIQTEHKFKIMMGLLLLSVLTNGVLMSIILDLSNQAPDKSPRIYIPEHMMPSIHQIS